MINFHFIKNFIKHYWSATRIDVLHSPFIFDLYNACIKKKNIHAHPIGKINSQLKIIQSTRIAQIVSRLIEYYQYNNTIVIENFDAELPKILTDYSQIDFAFIDCQNHSASIINNFEMLITKTHNNSLFIFNEMYSSKKLTSVWQKIKLHPKVNITVDLFFIGLVFFRKEQASQHFKLRIW